MKHLFNGLRIRGSLATVVGYFLWVSQARAGNEMPACVASWMRADGILASDPEMQFLKSVRAGGAKTFDGPAQDALGSAIDEALAKIGNGIRVGPRFMEQSGRLESAVLVLAEHSPDVTAQQLDVLKRYANSGAFFSEEFGQVDEGFIRGMAIRLTQPDRLQAMATMHFLKAEEMSPEVIEAFRRTGSLETAPLSQPDVTKLLTSRANAEWYLPEFRIGGNEIHAGFDPGLLKNSMARTTIDQLLENPAQDQGRAVAANIVRYINKNPGDSLDSPAVMALFQKVKEKYPDLSVAYRSFESRSPATISMRELEGKLGDLLAHRIKEKELSAQAKEFGITSSLGRLNRFRDGSLEILAYKSDSAPAFNAEMVRNGYPKLPWEAVPKGHVFDLPNKKGWGVVADNVNKPSGANSTPYISIHMYPSKEAAEEAAKKIVPSSWERTTPAEFALAQQKMARLETPLGARANALGLDNSRQWSAILPDGSFRIVFRKDEFSSSADFDRQVHAAGLPQLAWKSIPKEFVFQMPNKRSWGVVISNSEGLYSPGVVSVDGGLDIRFYDTEALARAAAKKGGR